MESLSAEAIAASLGITPEQLAAIKAATGTSSGGTSKGSSSPTSAQQQQKKQKKQKRQRYDDDDDDEEHDDHEDDEDDDGELFVKQKLDRHAIVNSGRVKRIKTGPRKEKTAADHAFEEAQALQSEWENRMKRVARWEHFLHRELKDSRVDAVVQEILGDDDTHSDSHLWREIRRRVMGMMRRFQCETLGLIEKWVKEWANSPSRSYILNPSNTIDENDLERSVTAAFSWDRFNTMWNYMKMYLDAENSSKVGRYYCEQLFVKTVMRTIKYLRLSAEDPRYEENEKKSLCNFFKDLPAHEGFDKVKPRHFKKKSPGKRQTKATLQNNATRQERLAEVTLPPMPSDSEETDDDGRARKKGSKKDKGKEKEKDKDKGKKKEKSKKKQKEPVDISSDSSSESSSLDD